MIDTEDPTVRRNIPFFGAVGPYVKVSEVNINSLNALIVTAYLSAVLPFVIGQSWYSKRFCGMPKSYDLAVKPVLGLNPTKSKFINHFSTEF
jgi:hypothetical protein